MDTSKSYEIQIKNLKCEQNVLKHTDGSALYSDGMFHVFS